jgi:hypothetical protein
MQSDWRYTFRYIRTYDINKVQLIGHQDTYMYLQLAQAIQRKRIQNHK